MLYIKAESNESDMKPGLPVIQRYIEDELVRYKQISKAMADDRTEEWEALNKVFLRLVGN